MSQNDPKRKLAAILSADARNYARLMSEDETGTVRTLKSCIQTMRDLIGRYRGRVVDASGDNLLAEFASVMDAVRCAVDIQAKIGTENESVPEDRRMVFRIGINLGDVIEEEGRIYGDGVNIAARIERLAEGGEVCISGTVYEQVRNRLPWGFEDRGEQTVKNIPEPVRLYRVVPDVAGPKVWRARFPGAARRKRILLATVPGAIVVGVATLLWSASARLHILPARAVPAASPGVSAPVALPAAEPPAKGPQPNAPRNETVSAKRPGIRVPEERPGASRDAGHQRPPPSRDGTVPERLPGVPLPEQPSIAVLPFENLSDDPDQEHLSDGFTDDIITTLSKLPRLFVISKSSTFTYKRKPAKAEQISRDLGARYVLEGSIQRSDNRLRINAQLIDGSTGKHIWSERYDRTTGDLFRTRDQLVLEIAAAMAGQLTDGDVALLIRRNTNSLEAWEALQRGHVFYERYTKEDNLRGREWYQKAADLDPKYVNALMNVGWTYYIEGRSFLTGEAREQAFDKAVGLAKKIIEMDPSYYGGYFLLSGVHWRRGQHDEAIAYGRKAVEMEPNNTFPVAVLGGILPYAGRPEEAIVLFQRAMRLSPYYRAWYLDGLGLAYHLTGQPDKAIETFKISAQRDPKAVYPHLRLAIIYAEQGRDDEMRAETAEVLRRNPKFSIETWTKSHSFKDPKIHEYRKSLMVKAGLPN